MIPIQDTVPRRNPPLAVYALIALNVLVFALELTVPPGDRERLFYLLGIEQVNTFMLTLKIDDRERSYLEQLLEADLGETRVEIRRTLAPDLHDELHRRENLIRGLLEKLRGARPPGDVGPGS